MSMTMKSKVGNRVIKIDIFVISYALKSDDLLLERINLV